MNSRGAITKTMECMEKVLKNKPNSLAVEVTYRCNLNCVYCSKRESGENHRDISKELLERLDPVIKDMKRIVICGIGESFLYSGLYDLISNYPKQKFTIVTNGTILIDYEILDAQKNIEQIIYSVDAVEQEIMDKICGKYRFDNLLRNLDLLDKYRRTHQRRITSVLNCTINKYNLGQMEKLIEFAKTYNFNVIHFSLPRGGEDFIDKEKENITAEIERAKEMAKNYNLFFVNPFDVCCVFYNCVPPYITLDGNVYACAETLYISDSLGNLFERSYDEILNDAKYKEFQTGQSCKECGFLQNTFIGRQIHDEYDR